MCKILMPLHVHLQSALGSAQPLHGNLFWGDGDEVLKKKKKRVELNNHVSWFFTMDLPCTNAPVPLVEVVFSKIMSSFKYTLPGLEVHNARLQWKVLQANIRELLHKHICRLNQNRFHETMVKTSFTRSGFKTVFIMTQYQAISIGYHQNLRFFKVSFCFGN